MRISWRRRLAFGMVATILVFTCLELGTRGWRAVSHRNPAATVYGWSFLRGVAADRDTTEATSTDELFERRDRKDDGLAPRLPGVETTDSGIPATINALGFRGAELTAEPKAGTVRIAAFGGSYVFGTYLRDEQTWPHQLEADLSARGMAVEVVNGGKVGADIHGVLADMIRITNRAKVDIAVVTSAYNNHSLLPIERRHSWARTADFYFTNVSLFYVTLKERVAWFMNQALDYGLYRQPIRVQDRDVEGLINRYALRLRQMDTLCRERGSELVLASQPEVFFDRALNGRSSQDVATLQAIRNRIQAGEAILIAELEFYLQGRLNRQARQTAAELALEFFDGESVLMADKAHYFVDQIHPNERGAKKLARALGAHLEPVVRARQVRRQAAPPR